MRLPIVGDSPPARAEERQSWPEPEAADLVVVFDARGGRRDAELLAALRAAGLGGAAWLAIEGAPQEAPLTGALAPGRSIRGRGPALVRGILDAHRSSPAGERPRIALGAAAARAFAAPLVVRIDGDTPGTAHATLARGVAAHLTLRDPELAVLLPLIGEFRES